MEKRVTSFISYRRCIVKALILLLFITSIAALLLRVSSYTANAYQLTYSTQKTRYIASLRLNPFTNATIFPTATSIPTPQASDQQVITEAQNNVTIAATIIYWSQYVLAGVGLIFGVVGFLGIREFGHFVRLRNESDLRLKEFSNLKQQVESLEKQVENQLEQLTQRADSEFQRLSDLSIQLTSLPTEEKQKFEQRLEHFSKQFESEGQNFMQTFMEASYNFNIATDAYRDGDNERAIEYFLLVLTLQPENMQVMERLGRAYSNLNDLNKAAEYLKKALAIDDSYVPALRSLALCYRYSDKDKAIDYFQQALAIDRSDHEAWDFLGLLYRDNQRIDEAISAHKQALELKRRPETLFYLSILYAMKGDDEGAKAMALNARYDLKQREHQDRIRPIWKELIRAGVQIIEGNEDEAYRLVKTLNPYITTRRTFDAVTGHLRFLLEATGHSSWQQKFISVLKVK